MRIEKIIIIKWGKIIVSKAKKLLSLFVGAAMTANIFATMPFTAFADEEIERTYTYDDYEVTYDVTNSWGNTELVAVTLSNTSDTTIENWMLYFEPNGQVHNVVNASDNNTPVYICGIYRESATKYCFSITANNVYTDATKISENTVGTVKLLVSDNGANAVNPDDTNYPVKTVFPYPF